MAGIYIHIPFCKQACHYCDFHFSTTLKRKAQLLSAIHREIALRRDELDGQRIETIYFGGGTPSILEMEEITEIVRVIRSNFSVVDSPEITLEANPDDLSNHYIVQLSKTPINRLSIGVQSFFDTDLKLMNRAHTALEAQQSVLAANNYFNNISIDLIYGTQGMTDENWLKNISHALDLKVPHISSYALTVEPKTALQKFIEKGIIDDVDDAQASRQFYLMVDKLEQNGYINYEISNFGKPRFFSQNNTAYWQGKSYMGIGPSAHSFDGEKRGWNIRNNIKYIDSLNNGKLPIEYEVLTKKDRYNEYVMTGLRTIWGVSVPKVERQLGSLYSEYLQNRAEKYVQEGLLFWDQESLLATKKGKFLVDGIASDLFMINLKQ